MRMAPLASMTDAIQLAARPQREKVRVTPGEASAYALTAIITLVLWLVCLSVGALGFAFPYARPQPLAKQGPPPVQAELLQVELANDPLPPPDAVAPPAAPSQPPPLPDPASTPPLPVLIAVAEPSPAIAFALPVEGLVRVVEARQAAHSVPPTAVVHTSTNASTTPAARSAAVARAPAPATETLVLGVGEGRQPAPAYPGRARREGQEGTVGVRLTVGEDGRVMGADAWSPAPWPLLNESAVRTVRQRWRFAAGRLRVYDVAIRFQISK